MIAPADGLAVDQPRPERGVACMGRSHQGAPDPPTERSSAGRGDGLPAAHHGRPTRRSPCASRVTIRLGITDRACRLWWLATPARAAPAVGASDHGATPPLHRRQAWSGSASRREGPAAAAPACACSRLSSHPLRPDLVTVLPINVLLVDDAVARLTEGQRATGAGTGAAATPAPTTTRPAAPT